MAYQRRQQQSTRPAQQEQPPATMPDTRTGKIQPAMKSAQEWKAYFEKAERQITAAFPKMVKFERVISCALSQMHANPRLFQCTPLSIMGGMIQSAQLGLDLDRNLGEAYMVPYQNSKKAADGSWMKVYEAQLQVGYQGLMKLVRNTGNIGDIRAQIVFENDVFDHEEGTTIKVHHIPYPMAKRKGLTDAPNKGNIIAVYSVCETKDGAQSVKVMYIDEVEAIRQRSRAKDDGPWVTDYVPMVKKTCIRQLCKMLPKSAEVATAIALDELHDANLPQGLDLIPMMATDPEVVDEINHLREEGLEQAEAQQQQAAPQPDNNLRTELLAKIQPHVDLVIAENGTDGLDKFLNPIRDAMKQPSDVQAWSDAALSALLAALEANP